MVGAFPHSVPLEGSFAPVGPERAGRRIAEVRSAISIQDLSKSFGDVRALDRVSLEVPTGSIFGLVGPNGAGKTTLIRALVGAIKADDGFTTVAGIDPAVDKYGARSHLGYMPQESVLYADLTARENVAFFYRGHHRSEIDETVDAALTFADLGSVADRMVHTLSGGLQQRVSLAVALAHQPEVLLLDEPTAGVDPELRHVFWQGFRRLAADGITIFITTHQMDEVIHCDRVALLRSGRILAEAPPVELLASGGATIRVHRAGDVSEFKVASSNGDLPVVLGRYGLDQAVTRIDVEAQTLEEVILGLVQRDRSAPFD